MNGFVLLITFFALINIAYILFIYKRRNIYFETISYEDKKVLKVDGLVAIISLLLISVEISCIASYVVAF